MPPNGHLVTIAEAYRYVGTLSTDNTELPGINSSIFHVTTTIENHMYQQRVTGITVYHETKKQTKLL